MVRENELKGFSPVSSGLSKNFAYSYFGLLVFFFPRYDVLNKKKHHGKIKIFQSWKSDAF